MTLNPVTVLATDKFGNLVPGATITMTLSVGSLSGATTAVTAATGLTNFTTLSVAIPGTFTLSAKTGNGVNELVEAVIGRMRGRYVRAKVHAAAANGRLLAYVRQYGHVLGQTYEDGTVILDLRLPNAEVPRVQALGGRFEHFER